MLLPAEPVERPAMPELHRILLTRHPETEANVAHTLSGRQDVDLTPAGVEQMYRAIEAVVAWRPERVWTSPLSRCRSIAEEAADRLGVPCEVHDNLAEIEFGPAQGRPVQWLRDQGYDFPWEIGADGRSRPYPGAESFEGMYARSAALLEELRPLTGRTACVTHGGLTRALLGQLFQAPLTEFWHLRIPNVSSQVLTYDGKAFALAALGLAPEEVVRRMEEPALLGRDTTEHIATGA